MHKGWKMRLTEFASAADALAMWKVISDNTWAAIAQQAEAEAKQKAERAAARKSVSTRGTGKSTAKPAPPKRLPPPLQHVSAPVAKDAKSAIAAAQKTSKSQQQQSVQATAAITNDSAFVTNMNKSIIPANADAMSVETNYAQSATNANLAMALVKALKDQTAANLATIATTVIGQDSGRARAADNSQLPTDSKQPLSFLAGDVVFVSITVNSPTISSLGGTAYDAAGTGTAITSITAQKFDLKITLN